MDQSEAFRSALAAEREEVGARLASLNRQFDDFVESSAFVSTDDEHDPDGSTVAFERAKIGALQTQAAAHLSDVDEALRRLDSGTFGTCEKCGGPIGAERLIARPRSRHCFGCASSGGAHPTGG